MAMTSRERMVRAITGGVPDRLPVTTHHVMQYFLDRTMGGISKRGFLDHFGFDGILWTVPHRGDPDTGEYPDPSQGEVGFLESQRVSTDEWRIKWKELPDPEYRTVRYTFLTPKGTLSMVLQSNEYTAWVSEYLIKDRRDIDIIGEFVTAPKCDVEAVNLAADEVGDWGIVRGHIPCFDIFGQPGTWQDAACLVGIEKLILAAYDDPEWVHQLLGILHRRKVVFIHSLEGARYDILELGGGDASSTVISPKLFEEFVGPYDSELIALAHEAGQRISYHTCGGMMPMLDLIADMNPDAMETFTPPAMGGDTDLREAKNRIGDRVCMIGGFDQFHFLVGCTPEETRAEVRRCFEEAGEGGGFVLCPSDHFFDADLELLSAFADEARRCTYG